MATLKTSFIQHPDSLVPQISLSASGMSFSASALELTGGELNLPANTTISGSALATESDLSSGLELKLDVDSYTSPGLQLITTEFFSSISSVSINNCFSSTYTNYRIIMFITHNAGADFNLRWRSGGNDNLSANSYITTRFRVQNTTLGGLRTTDNFAPVGVSRPEQTFWLADVFRPFDDVATTLSVQTMDASGGTAADYYAYSGYHNQNISYDGFTIYVASGTLSGQIKIYGYKD